MQVTQDLNEPEGGMQRNTLDLTLPAGHSWLLRDKILEWLVNKTKAKLSKID